MSLYKPTGCLLPVGKVAEPLQDLGLARRKLLSVLCELGILELQARDGAGRCSRPWGAELSSGEHLDSALHTQ